MAYRALPVYQYPERSRWTRYTAIADLKFRRVRAGGVRDDACTSLRYERQQQRLTFPQYGHNRNPTLKVDNHHTYLVCPAPTRSRATLIEEAEGATILASIVTEQFYMPSYADTIQRRGSNS